MEPLLKKVQYSAFKIHLDARGAGKGVSVELKRQTADGGLVPVTENHMAGLE